MVADELLELSIALGGSGALWRERIESLFLRARAMMDPSGLEILMLRGSGEFLIGDAPALAVRADGAGVGVLGGIALAEAQSDFLPLGPRHAAAPGKAGRIIPLSPAQVAGVHARQLSGAIDYVYLRPGSRLPDTGCSFAQQRKNAFGTATA